MSKSNGQHVPTMLVVGLGMLLIAALAAVAAWAWSHKRGPLLERQRARRAASSAKPTERESIEMAQNGSVEAAEA